MANVLSEFMETVTPTEADSRLAEESSRRLARYFGAKRKSPFRVRIETDGEPEEAISIPVAALRLFAVILSELAHGNAMNLFSVQTEFSTQLAAAIIYVY